jgi:CheY-like chemotaxis protein
MTNTREPALVWLFVSESSIGITGGSGSNPYQEADRPSVSHCPSEERGSELRHVLIVEDNPADVFLIRAAIETANIHASLHVVKDGEQAVRFFDETEADITAPCPGLVVLDINLPRKQGGDVLRHIRQGRKCGNVIVIAVSTSDSAQDREQMMNLGANGYFRKPSEYVDFMKLGDIIKRLLGQES